MIWNIKHLRKNNEKLEEVLLINRNIDISKLNNFLNPNFDNDVHSPFLINDIEKATKRIIKAINNNEKIAIYGDYDVDGITSATILYKAFKTINYENIIVYLPHRLYDGYGLNKNAIKKLYNQNVSLIITVDCGISNVDEIDFANDLNIDIIVTDHHNLPKKLPKAYSILHTKLSPNYPFKSLAGVGVAYKLAWAILTNYLDENKLRYFLLWNLDIVAIGTVADNQVLLDENRTIVSKGLIVLNKTKNTGLKNLYKISSIKEINIYNILFIIAPRINAAGRLDDPKIAFDLLNTEDELMAYELAKKLDNLNKERQNIFKSMMNDALNQIKNNNTKSNSKKIIILHKENWHHGVIGLISGKICDQLNRPVISFEKRKNIYIASARSIENFNITKALSLFDNYLIKYGGHEQAAGFAIHENNFDIFCQLISDYCEKNLDLKEKILNIECPLFEEELTIETYNKIKLFEPFGEGNNMPTFTMQFEVKKINKIGNNNQHLSLFLKNKNKYIDAIWFDFDKKKEHLLNNNHINVAFELMNDTYKNNQKLRLKVIDISNHVN